MSSPDERIDFLSFVRWFDRLRARVLAEDSLIIFLTGCLKLYIFLERRMSRGTIGNGLILLSSSDISISIFL